MTEKIETGCVSGTCFNGFGKRIYENGDWYEGEWKNAKRHGKGFFQFAEGFYDGEWKENQFHGKGNFFTIIKGKDTTYSEYATFKNGEFVDSEGSYEISQDLHIESLYRLSNPFIFDSYKDPNDMHTLCQLEDARKVVNNAFSMIHFDENKPIQNKYFRKPELLPEDGFPSSIMIKELNDIDESNGIRISKETGRLYRTEDGFDFTDYHLVSLFFSCLFIITRELSKNFEIPPETLFGFEDGYESGDFLKAKEIENIAKFVSDNYKNFYYFPLEFEKAINTKIKKFYKENEQHMKNMFISLDYDANVKLEDLSVKKGSLTKSQFHPNTAFNINYKLINRNYPDELRHINAKLERFKF